MGMVSFGMRDQVRKVPHAAHTAATKFEVGSANSQETLVHISFGTAMRTRSWKRANHWSSWTFSTRSGLNS